MDDFQIYKEGLEKLDEAYLKFRESVGAEDTHSTRIFFYEAAKRVVDDNPSPSKIAQSLMSIHLIGVIRTARISLQFNLPEPK